MDLDEMLRVDRCRDMYELINFLSPIRIIVRMPEPDCFHRYHIGYGTNLQPCHRLPASCAATRIYVGEIPLIGLRIGGTPLERAVVLNGFIH